MNLIRASLASILFSSAFTIGMEITFPTEFPQDVSELIIYHQLLDIHNQVNTPKDARAYVNNISLVNKQCNQFTNDPYTIRTIISNLSATLRTGTMGMFIFYEETLAKKLNTPATKHYLDVNNALFSDHLTKADVESLLQQGADPNYRRIIDAHHNLHDPEKYKVSRHCHSGMPLSFYVWGSTDKDFEIAQCLLEHGANVNKKSNYDYYPLSIAIHQNSPQMVKLLLAYNPVFCEQSLGEERNYLARATQRGNAEIIKLIMKATPCSDFKSALLAAVIDNKQELIQEYFDHGAQPDSILAQVVNATLEFPVRSSGNRECLLLGSLKTTDILQLICKNGIQDQKLLDDALEYADIALQRAQEVIEILKSAKK